MSQKGGKDFKKSARALVTRRKDLKDPWPWLLTITRSRKIFNDITCTPASATNNVLIIIIIIIILKLLLLLLLLSI